MNTKERQAIVRKVRKYCDKHKISGAQLSNETGLSNAACCKLITRNPNAARTTTPKHETAELVAYWLEERERQDKLKELTDNWVVPEGANPQVWARVDGEPKPKYVRGKDREELEAQVRVLQGQLAAVEDQLARSDEAHATAAAELRRTLEELEKVRRQRDKLLELL